MKTKIMIAFSLFGIVSLPLLAQINSIDYFGQTPPGDSAVIFAPGIISLQNRLESKITFSPNSEECYFDVVIIEQIKPPVVKNKIYFTRLVNNTWTEQSEASFAKNLNAGRPVFSIDGKKLYYNLKDSTNTDIYFVEQINGVWDKPHRLPSPINSQFSEPDYSEKADGTAYISSKRPDGKDIDIWGIQTLPDKCVVAENLGTKINSSTFDFSPCIAPDGSYLIFCSERNGRAGRAHIYITFNNGNDGWTSPINMNNGGAMVNDNHSHHINPTLSPDGKYLFFSRHEKNTIMDIYWVSTKVIEDIRKVVFNSKDTK